MKALQCEFCGGKLMAKAGDIFECTSCGMLYDKGRIQEMVQEITGTVQIEGLANADSLLRRSYILLEDGKWTEAADYFEKVLSIEPENARAYVGKLLAARHLPKIENLSQDCEFANNANWKNAKKFADATLSEEMTAVESGWLNHQIELKKVSAILRKRNMIAAGWRHNVGLKADGSVVACGNNSAGQCEVSAWRDITAVAAGYDYTVGLKADGSVVACGNNSAGQCEVSTWQDIVAVAAGKTHTVGLKADGNVVATNYTKDKRFYKGQCEVSAWRDITAVAAGYDYTVGLKADGSVVACGNNSAGQCEVSAWRNITAIAAGNNHTVGLRTDGKVVACGYNFTHQCEVNEWNGVSAIAACEEYTVGLKADGSVVLTHWSFGFPEVFGWRDIVDIAAGSNNVVALRSDGSVVITKYADDSVCGDVQYTVSEWVLFDNEEQLRESTERSLALEEQRCVAAKNRRIAEEKDAEERRIAAAEEYRMATEKARQDQIAALNQEKSNLKTELSNLRGLFTGARRKEIETRLAEIDSVLAKMH